MPVNSDFIHNFMEPLHNGLDQIPFQLPSTYCWRFLHNLSTDFVVRTWLSPHGVETFRIRQSSVGSPSFYIMALKVYIFQAGICIWRLLPLSCFKMWVTILCHWKSFVLSISTNNAQYIFFYFNNIYIIITPTCFDTFVPSSGSSKAVHR